MWYANHVVVITSENPNLIPPDLLPNERHVKTATSRLAVLKDPRT